MNKIKYKNYILLTPFKRWTLENFPFIEADFDAITNYQLYCKIVEYLNNVISNQNQVQELGNELVTAYNQLLDYVNNYFDNLDIQEEVNNKLDEMVEDGTLSDIIGQYVDLTDNVYIAPLTNVDTYKDANSKACLGISFDGQCFTPIPDTEGFCTKDTDIQLFKYNDYYLFACTTGASESSPNIDAYVGWTQDFETYHFESVSLGFSQYRNTHYPEASSDYRRWTPRFYLDKENNLNILLSMATTSTLENDAWEIQQRTKMAIFHQTVTFNGNDTNFLTGNGDIDVFKIRENNTDIETFFDGELLYKDNVYYLFYKNGYYNDVCIAISTTDDYAIFNATKLNLFGQPYTEAPTIVKNGDGYYLYGQQYRVLGFNSMGRNMLLYTEDFNTFNAIGFPKRLYNNIETKGWMRNISPCLITNKALILKFKGKLDLVGYGCYDNDDLKIQYTNQKTLEIYKQSYTLGRTVSVIPNSWINRDTTIQDIHINNIWNTTNFVIAGANANLNPYAIQFSYKNLADRIVMTGSYPTCSFNITYDMIRHNNRSMIPTTYKSITGTSDKANMSSEVIITPNSLFAKAHVYNSNNANVWSADETIINLGVKNQQNNMQICGVMRSNHDVNHPQGSTHGFYVDSNGNVKCATSTPACAWSADFIFMLPTNFYNDFS